jgi:xanthine dehydrogenase YagR molybdenum-binding subunit
VDRVDGRLKVTGGARFTAEYSLDGLAYAAPVFSTIAKGRVRRLDTGDAERSPGVIAVVTPQNMPRLKPPTLLNLEQPDKFAASDLPILQDDRVHWNGQVIAVVVAETHEQAQEAASWVQVDTTLRSGAGVRAGKAAADVATSG